MKHHATTQKPRPGLPRWAFNPSVTDRLQAVADTLVVDCATSCVGVQVWEKIAAELATSAEACEVLADLAISPPNKVRIYDWPGLAANLLAGLAGTHGVTINREPKRC